jgi:hypothetical protein
VNNQLPDLSDHIVSVDLDLGDGHYLAWTTQALYDDTGKVKEDEDGQRITDERGPIGAIICHRRPSGGWCAAGITFDVSYLHEGYRTRGGQPVPLWKIESLDPLTLSPSLLCHCRDHGFIKEGRWIRA